MTTREEAPDLLYMARLEREHDDLREAATQARRHVRRVIDACTFGDVAGEQLREAYGAAEDALRWLEYAPEGRREEKQLNGASSKRARRTWPLWQAGAVGWCAGTTFAVTAWGGMPVPSVAWWIYAGGALGMLLLAHRVGWLQGRER